MTTISRITPIYCDIWSRWDDVRCRSWEFGAIGAFTLVLEAASKDKRKTNFFIFSEQFLNWDCFWNVFELCIENLPVNCGCRVSSRRKSGQAHLRGSKWPQSSPSGPQGKLLREKRLINRHLGSKKDSSPGRNFTYQGESIWKRRGFICDLPLFVVFRPILRKFKPCEWA